MNGCHGNGYHTLDGDDYATVAGTLYFQENTFMAFEVTARYADTGTFREVQLVGLEVKEVVIVSAGNGNEALHIDIGNDDLTSATGIGDVLEVADPGLHTLHVRRAGVDEKKVMDHRDKRTDFLAAFHDDLVLHGDETAQMLFFKEAHGVRFAAVGGTHGVPNSLFGNFFRYLFGYLSCYFFGDLSSCFFRGFCKFFIRFHKAECSEKGVPPGL